MATKASKIATVDRSAFVPLVDGAVISRFITDDGLLGMGGGVIVFEQDAQIPTWTVKYDEILYVTKGELTIETEGETLVATAGETILLQDGATVVYTGKVGTEIFYTLYPIDWETRGA